MKTDPRTRYTEGIIREAYYQLLKDHPASRITVKEICEVAQINRGTFYHHYADVTALRDAIEGEILSGLREMFVSRRLTGKEMLLGILREIRDHKGYYDLLVQKEDAATFQGKMIRLAYENLDQEEDADWVASRYIVGGVTSVISEWVYRGFSDPEEALAERILELTGDIQETDVRISFSGK